MLLAAQSQSLRTNLVKSRIDKTQIDSKCRMCKKVDESITHIVSGCSNLAQKEYKRRHDCVAKALHWDISRQKGFIVSESFYIPLCVYIKLDFLWLTSCICVINTVAPSRIDSYFLYQVTDSRMLRINHEKYQSK